MTLQAGEKRLLSSVTPARQLRVTVTHDLPGLDVSLFGLNTDRRLEDDRYFIFYNQPESPAGELRAEIGDGETTFTVQLDTLPTQARRLVFVATHDERPVREARRLVWQLCGTRFEPLSALREERAVMIAELYERAGEWRFGAIGQGFNGGLKALLESFGGEVEPETPEPEEVLPLLWDGTPWNPLGELPGDPPATPGFCRRCKQADQEFNRVDPQSGRCSGCQTAVQRAQHKFRQAFLQASFPQDLTAQEWNRLYDWAEQHRLDGRKLLEYVRADAASVLNRAVTLAVADGILSEEEENYLSAMMDAFELPPALTHAVNKSMTDLRQAQGIRSGQLQTVPTPFPLQPGELCYADIAVDFNRILTRGVRIVPGRLLVTSRCISFHAADMAYNIRYKNILSLDEHQSGIFLQLSVKQGSGFYASQEARILAATIQAMLDVERRQIYLDGDKASRRIPRHIQNEVYSRDQGKCIECGSRTELQFDHIIPYSLGGANEPANLQLLCKTCNLQKSNRF